jgi:caspase domain-containing protein
MKVVGWLVLGVSLVIVSGTSIVGASPEDADDSAPSRCTATAQNPIAVCFPDRPLRVQHCGALIIPDFDIDIWHAPQTATVGYRYSYRLVFDGAAQKAAHFPEQNATTFPYTGSPDLSRESFPFRNAGRYALRVTVTAESGQTFESTSPELELTDKPRVRGLAVGISEYGNPDYNLNYPAGDARTFHTALTELLGTAADVKIDLRTSDNGADLSKFGILSAINAVVAELPDGATPEQEAEWEASRLCGQDDWYVFYYSGHGIVGVDANGTVGRYLSTPSFNSKKLTLTSIRVTQLAAALFGTSAKNVLVVLDSCFSGFHRRGIVGGQPASRTGKVLYAADGLVTEYPPAGNGDEDVLKEGLERFGRNAGRGVVIAAASADREAEEGPVKYSANNGQLLLDFERSSVAANKTRKGYGLFTFTWLANLLTQVPAGTDVSHLLPDGKAPMSATCFLDFDAAAASARADIHALGIRKAWTLQSPESAMTGNAPTALRCTSASCSPRCHR